MQVSAMSVFHFYKNMNKVALSITGEQVFLLKVIKRPLPQVRKSFQLIIMFNMPVYKKKAQ